MQAPILSRDPRRPRQGRCPLRGGMKAARHARLDRGLPAARSCPAVGGSRCLGPEPSLALAGHAIARAVLLPASSQLHAAARDLRWIAGGYSLILRRCC